MDTKVTETETHFHVGSMRIAKKGLTNGTSEAIRQHLACGGKVKPKKMAEGGDPAVTDPAAQGALAAVEAALGPPVPGGQEVWASPSPQQSAASALPGATTPDSRTAYDPGNLQPVPTADTPEERRALMDKDLEGIGKALAAVPMALADVVTGGLASHSLNRGQPPEPSKLVPVSDAVAAEHRRLMGEPELRPGPWKDAGAYQPDQSAVLAPSPQNYVDPSQAELDRVRGQFGQPMKDYEQASRVRQEATAQVERMKGDFANLSAGIAQGQVDALQATQKGIESRYHQDRIRQEQMIHDILSTKIDPNRFWSEASTGQRIAGAIGMLLSGMGSGVTGQQNLAMDVINKSIERDIAAQHANLGTKNTVLSYYRQRSQDDIGAKMLSVALAKDTVAAQLQKNAMLLEGTVAGQRALAAAAQLKQESAQTRMQFYQGQIQLAQATSETKFRIAQIDAINRLVIQGQGADQGRSAAQLLAMLPETDQKKAVLINSRNVVDVDKQGFPIYGPTQVQVAFTNDPTGKTAEKAKQVEDNVLRAQDAVNNFRSVSSQMKSGSFDPQLVARAKAVMYELHGPLNLLSIGGNPDTTKEYSNITKLINEHIAQPDKVWGANWDKPLETISLVDRLLSREKTIANSYYVNQVRR